MAKCGVLENLLLKEHTHTFVNTGVELFHMYALSIHHCSCVTARNFAAPCAIGQIAIEVDNMSWWL